MFAVRHSERSEESPSLNKEVNMMFCIRTNIEMNMTKNICIEFNKLRPCGKPDIFHKIIDFGKSSQINSG